MASSSDFTSRRRNYLFEVNRTRRLRRPAGFRQSGRCLSAEWAKQLFLMFIMVLVTLGAAGCKKPVSVPDLVNQDLDQAQKTLATVQLKPGTISGAPGPGAYVASQSPGALQQVPAGSKVDLVVKMPVQVPSLVGSSITDAVSVLQGVSLKVAFVQERSKSLFSKTKVSSQNPAAGSLIHEGGLVTLTVSTPANIEALVSLAAQESEYLKLKPEYKGILDLFLSNPGVSRSMADQDMPNSPIAPSTSSTPPK